MNLNKKILILSCLAFFILILSLIFSLNGIPITSRSFFLMNALGFPITYFIINKGELNDGILYSFFAGLFTYGILKIPYAFILCKFSGESFNLLIKQTDMLISLMMYGVLVIALFMGIIIGDSQSNEKENKKCAAHHH
jgi:hypothetical protein